MEHLVEARLNHADRAYDGPHEEAEAYPSESPHVELCDALEKSVRYLPRLRGELLGGYALALALLLAHRRDDLRQVVLLPALDVRDHGVDLLVDLLPREVVRPAELGDGQQHAEERHEREHREVREPRGVHGTVARTEVADNGLHPENNLFLHAV